MKYLLFYICILYLCTIRLSESYILEADLTNPYDNDFYGGPPSIPFCTFTYKVILKDVDNSGMISYINLVPGSIVEAKFVALGNNLIGIDFSAQFNVGTNGTFAIAPIVGANIPITTYDCQSVPPPQLLNPSELSFQGPINLDNEYSLLLKLNLTKRTNWYSVKTSDPYQCNTGSFLGYQNLIIICSLKSINPVTSTGTLPPNIDFIISNSYVSINAPVKTFLKNVIQSSTPVITEAGYYSQSATFMVDFYYQIKIENYPSIVEVVLVNNSQSSGSIPAYTHLVYGNPNNREIIYTIPGTAAAAREVFYTYQAYYVSSNLNGTFYENSLFEFPINLKPPIGDSIDPNQFDIFPQYPDNYELHIFIFNSTEYKAAAQLNSFTNPGFKYGVMNGTYGIADVLSSGYSGSFWFEYYPYALNPITPEVAPPIITSSFSILPLNGMKMLVVINIQDDTPGFYRMDIGPYISIMLYDLVSGDQYAGTYQKLIDYSKFNSFKNYIEYYDIAGNKGVISGDLLDFKYPFVVPHFNNYVGLYGAMKISTIRFMIGGGKSNVIDLSEVGCQNRLYVNFTYPQKTMVVRLVLNPLVDAESLNQQSESDDVYYGYWDDKANMFAIDFQIQARAFTGIVPYFIYYPDLYFYSHELQYMGFDDSSQLYVHSEYADRMPPVVTKVTASPSNTVLITVDSRISWIFTIEDPYNGFKSGIVKIRSNVTPTFYTFNLISNGQKLDNYTIGIDLKAPCTSEQFFIHYMELEDTSGVISKYTSSKPSEGISPLLKVMDSDQLMISTICQFSSDTSPPSLVSYLQSVTTMDVLSNNREVTMYFILEDPSGLSSSNLPECYAQGVLLEQVIVRAEMVNQSQTQGTYVCNLQFPYGFGHAGSKIILSIHGFYDSVLNGGGLSSIMLSTLDPPGYITITKNQDIAPIIESTSPLSNMGGFITINGRNFQTSCQFNDIVVQVAYEKRLPIIMNFTIESYFNTIMYFNLPLQNKPEIWLLLYCPSTGATTRNVFQVKTYTAQPIPTSPAPNKPCPGTPACGGSSNGMCNTYGRCICIDPWFGADCLSRNIIRPPTINTTNPDIGNDFNSTLPDGETVSLKTLISLLALKELKPDGTIENEFNFTSWVYTNTTGLSTVSQEYTYKTNVTSNGLVTTVQATIQYYSQKTTIFFAGEKLDLLPSSLKYKIDISKYAYISKLNTLQLVMLASLQSTSNQQSCSLQETGDIDEDSEYVKLQIDTHSLYGRFIKRGIIDNRIQSVSNSISSQQTGTESISFIYINIPNFQSNAILDPDFSVLIDTTPASDKSQSTCSSDQTTDQGLTKSQLAGIIIGAVGFTIVAVVSITYILYKKKMSIINLAKLTNKLKGMNNK
ncbi:EGF-like domain-containing protein [Tieghemostelium lacteum]|uniref:EGF-like domain-containing protein n=1 Tax=Tieghemostelium lacteum TaxID=361077 RepID=A0A151Z7W1_TIELA|nr:EGF-like domain-containing protein [Tieghemostelium lacteum]|eukprot:KYQ90018.1 EGF-like domain-containing protein [Tieghemostelium lacteum]